MGVFPNENATERTSRKPSNRENALKPTSAHVRKYYEALAVSRKHGHTTEGNTRFAFEELLRRCFSPYGWHLVPEYAFKGTDKQPLRADGALVDDLTDARSGIVNDLNREDDPQYILRLIGQVITVSLETQSIIAALPSLGLGEP